VGGNLPQHGGSCDPPEKEAEEPYGRQFGRKLVAHAENTVLKGQFLRIGIGQQ